MKKIIKILFGRTFLPAYITQFLGAFNDNLFRTSMAAFIMFKIATISGGAKTVMASIAVGIFILPYFLFSSFAGELADKYRKDKIIKITKFIEILIAVFAVSGFYFYNPYILLVTLFLMGAQSTFFSPVKYSILPDILKEDELIAGNGLLEAGTYGAILLGTIAGGAIMSDSGNFLKTISVWVLAVAVIGFLCSLLIPKIKENSPDIKVNKNFFASTIKNIKFVRRRRDIYLCILGISWFWLVGAVLIAQMPALASNVFKGDASLFTFMLILFSCGIGLGSLVCQWLVKGKITSKYLPISALIMTFFLIDIAFASSSIVILQDGITYKEFLAKWIGKRISADLFLFAFFGGIYIVPLNTMLQVLAGDKMRSRIIATGNIINSLFMVIGSGVCALLLIAGLGTPSVFAVLALSNFLVAIYICGLLPEHTVRRVVKVIMELVYDIKVKGIENFENSKRNSLIIANHTSFLDAVLLWVYFEGKVYFAINTDISKRWWVRPLLHLVTYFPIDPTKPMGVKSIINAVESGHRVVIFPEGRITMTGSLMKIYPGPSMIADKSNADILPVWIEGSQYSVFSRFGRKMKTRPESKIVVNIMPPVKFELPDNVTGRNRRTAASRKLYDIMCNMKVRSTDLEETLFDSVLDACALTGKSKKILEDTSRKPITYRTFLASVFAFSRVIRKNTFENENVGFLLPNSTAAVIGFFSLSACGRVPCMLNFSSGAKNLISCCKSAGVKRILTSREFIRRAGLENAAALLKENGIEILEMENFKNEITSKNKIFSFLMTFIPRTYYKHIRGSSNSKDTAAVLFTSGSEGVPKGVALSHENIQANCAQLSSVIDFGVLDNFFNAMPIFHSFGLTAGLVIPMIKGIKVFMYPSPLHYRIVPELIYDTNSTVMFGTDTFLSGYAKVAHPYDFYSVRIVVAGAEKLKEQTAKIWADTFGIRVLEGYGATETAPAIAINTPMYFKRGSVGRMLPGIEYKLEKVEGINDGGELVVKGANIMQGYYKSDKPAILQSLKDGWYDTGDIVDIDENGFVFIKGRTKRFAKIAGEMISLGAVEETVKSLFPEDNSACISVPDEKKGEQLVLFTTNKNLKRNELLQMFKQKGLSELWAPKEIININEILLTGTGKTDYIKLAEIYARK